MWILFMLLAVISIVGGLMLLLRTAKTTKVPKGFKRKRYDDDDLSGW